MTSKELEWWQEFGPRGVMGFRDLEDIVSAAIATEAFEALEQQGICLIEVYENLPPAYKLAVDAGLREYRNELIEKNMARQVLGRNPND
jgi:hypothetical protein